MRIVPGNYLNDFYLDATQTNYPTVIKPRLLTKAESKTQLKINSCKLNLIFTASVALNPPYTIVFIPVLLDMYTGLCKNDDVG